MPLSITSSSATAPRPSGVRSTARPHQAATTSRSTEWPRSSHRQGAARRRAVPLCFGTCEMAEHEPCVGKSSDWFSPKFLFDALDLVFDLDPAHPGPDNPYWVVPARKIYTKAEDGLRQPWSGLVWLGLIRHSEAGAAARFAWSPLTPRRIGFTKSWPRMP